MADVDLAALEEEIKVLSNELLERSDELASLRADGACDRGELKRKEDEMKVMYRSLKSLLRKRPGNLEDTEAKFDQHGTDSLLKRRFFIAPSFEIYGGVAGFFDFGPPGCAVKTNVVQLWRHHFVVQESMMEFEGSCLTPEPVLVASGHVARFSDLLVKDVEKNACFRADHILQEHLEAVCDDPAATEETKSDAEDILARIDGLVAEEIDVEIKRWNIRAPETGNELSPAAPFNLMFESSIGPAGNIKAYLRPETAQGIFVNFKRLLDFSGSRMPFACAQIGLSFRNEIAPRKGLTRVREFMQAEIEHFVHPDQKDHPKFDLVKDCSVSLFSRVDQLTTRMPVDMTIGDAVNQKIIDNQTLAYFIARTQMFAESMGLKREHLRFRQHQQLEMAHYAKDCWDLEINCSYGWVECVGLADRSCFDLENHSHHSKIELNAREVFDEVKSIEVLEAVPNKSVMGKAFKKEGQEVMRIIAGWNDAEAKERLAKFESGAESLEVVTEAGKSFAVTKDMVTFEKTTQKVSGRNYYPSVIEPSFGIGRLLHCMFEHVYYVRGGDDEARCVLAFPPAIAPIKTAVLPLQKNDGFLPILAEVGKALGDAGMIYRIDETGASIGKRYARFDELGTPFGITVDFDTLNDRTVTLRERDTMRQVRGDLTAIVAAIESMVRGKETWENIEARFPSFSSTTE